MPSKPASSVADACAQRASYVTRYARRIASRCNSEADRNQVFAGAYVSYLAFFESQIEELFVGLLTAAYTHPSRHVRPQVPMPNRSKAKSIVTAGRSYVDWLPYDQHTRKRAPGFLVDGEPFTSLSKPHRSTLEKASVLRNALAHHSDHSQRRFTQEFIDGRAIPLSQRKPPSYLRGAHSRKHNRLEVHLMELVAIMQELTT